MKRFIAFAACAAVMMCVCGCASGTGGSPNDSSAAEDIVAEEEYIPIGYHFVEGVKNEEWQPGGKLTYSDFVADKDYIEEFALNENINYVENYVFWNAKYADGEFQGAGRGAPRLNRYSRVEDVLEMYGDTQLYDVDTLTDKFYNNILYSGYEDDAGLIEDSVKYAQYLYKLPGLEGPFEQYMSLKFYFDDVGEILIFAMCLNEDLMLNYHFKKEGRGTVDTSVDTSFDPDGRTFKPSLVMKGVFDYEKPRTDRPYPLYSFDGGVIRAEWYNYDGTKPDEHPESVFDKGVGYKWENGEIVLELDGYDEEEVYFVYDRNLQSYELHEPCWRDEGVFLQLTEVRS